MIAIGGTIVSAKSQHNFPCQGHSLHSVRVLSTQPSDLDSDSDTPYNRSSPSRPRSPLQAGLILQYWWPNLHMWIPALIFIIFLVGMTLLGVSDFGELEYWLSMFKVITCVLFILVGILVDADAVGDELIGNRTGISRGPPIVGEDCKEQDGQYLYDVFGGTELVGITAGESANTEKSIPKAIRHTFWRIMLFLILSAMVIVLAIPWADENLIGSALAEVSQAAPMAPFHDYLQDGQAARSGPSRQRDPLAVRAVGRTIRLLRLDSYAHGHGT
ncbi:hypothetical protein EC957_005778 [Mortierella hygrophila]|uniref:Amino acid permease/ SLC12A domain-containing protein n=1 Tax=Mortierella hygrophila TaxID=979708 RepID=A0A9P6F094_9FUNG|nr:hypothetical protein EC957_005778 [Mortierella hygrophila]